MSSEVHEGSFNALVGASMLFMKSSSSSMAAPVSGSEASIDCSGPSQSSKLQERIIGNQLNA